MTVPAGALADLVRAAEDAEHGLRAARERLVEALQGARAAGERVAMATHKHDWTRITAYGLFPRSVENDDQDEPEAAQVETCRLWLRTFAMPTKTIRSRETSYGYKHRVEDCCRPGQGGAGRPVGPQVVRRAVHRERLVHRRAARLEEATASCARLKVHRTRCSTCDYVRRRTTGGGRSPRGGAP